eukprot:tig00001388_g8586.t1
MSELDETWPIFLGIGVALVVFVIGIYIAYKCRTPNPSRTAGKKTSDKQPLSSVIIDGGHPKDAGIRRDIERLASTLEDRQRQLAEGEEGQPRRSPSYGRDVPTVKSIAAVAMVPDKTKSPLPGAPAGPGSRPGSSARSSSVASPHPSLQQTAFVPVTSPVPFDGAVSPPPVGAGAGAASPATGGRSSSAKKSKPFIPPLRLDLVPPPFAKETAAAQAAPRK